MGASCSKYQEPDAVLGPDQNSNASVSTRNQDFINTFHTLSEETKQAMIQSIKEVIEEAKKNKQWSDRKKWWNAYIRANGGDNANLAKFFEDWLNYSPVPDEGKKKKKTVLPSKRKHLPTGIPDSPGYYIEKWDWLANTQAGLALNGFDEEFREWFKTFLNLHGEFLKTPESKKSIQDWKNYKGTSQHPFDIHDYVIPEGDLKNFNEFFLRFVREGKRFVSQADISNKFSIVSPSDGGIFYLTKSSDTNEEYDLPSKRNDKFNLEETFPGYGSRFVGGPLTDTLLWFTDFHHFFSPVAGKVIDMKDYPGSYNYDFENLDTYHPNKPKPGPDSDQVGWYKRLSTHKRFVWIIETESMGLVGMAAIGFWGVGSIVVDDNDKSTWPKDVVPVKKGDSVQKGQYLGHFGYGGSSIILAFQPTINGQSISYDFSVTQKGDSGVAHISDANQPIQVNAMQHIGTANINDSTSE